MSEINNITQDMNELESKAKNIDLRKLKKKERLEKREVEQKKKENNQNEDKSAHLYSKQPLNMSQRRTNKVYSKVSEINESTVDQSLWFRGRCQKTRGFGNNCFIILRQSQNTLQCVVFKSNLISKEMVRFCIGIPHESIIDIFGQIVAVDQPVEKCTVHHFELHVKEVHIISESQPQLPLLIEHASRPIDSTDGLSTANQDTCLDNRVLDLRTTTNQAIFRLQAAICILFREFLNGHHFTELHFPKIIGSSSEGGANVFRLDYFKRPAFLAQSPQLYKQMVISGDFERVYTIGAVFRAEDSNTHRHLCEFTGLDIEMAFYEHYHEVVEMIGKLFIYIFKGLEERYQNLIDIVRLQFPSEAFLYTDEPLILNYKEGVQMLKNEGIEINDFDDLSTPNEKLLGKLVKEKYKTDFYILDKYPLNVRPFYTMPDPHNPNLSNSYDMFMRGEEILSGAQRIHDPELLSERARYHNMDLEKIKPYIDSFRYGSPPHAGGGIGLERVLSFYLNLGNIRKTSMFPRDPKRLDP